MEYGQSLTASMIKDLAHRQGNGRALATGFPISLATSKSHSQQCLNTLLQKFKYYPYSLTKLSTDVIAVKLLEPSTIRAMENLAQKICIPQEIQKAMGHTLRQLRQGI